MSAEDDVSQEVERILSVTLDEMIRFLSERKAERPCEACGREVDWVIRADGQKPVLTQSWFYNNTNQVDVHFSVFCPECGNTRLFNARYVGAYVTRTRGAKNGER